MEIIYKGDTKSIEMFDPIFLFFFLNQIDLISKSNIIFALLQLILI